MNNSLTINDMKALAECIRQEAKNAILGCSPHDYTDNIVIQVWSLHDEWTAELRCDYVADKVLVTEYGGCRLDDWDFTLTSIDSLLLYRTDEHGNVIYADALETSIIQNKVNEALGHAPTLHNPLRTARAASRQSIAN